MRSGHSATGSPKPPRQAGPPAAAPWARSPDAAGSRPGSPWAVWLSGPARWWAAGRSGQRGGGARALGLSAVCSLSSYLCPPAGRPSWRARPPWGRGAPTGASRGAVLDEGLGQPPAPAACRLPIAPCSTQESLSAPTPCAWRCPALAARRVGRRRLACDQTEAHPRHQATPDRDDRMLVVRPPLWGERARSVARPLTRERPPAPPWTADPVERTGACMDGPIPGAHLPGHRWARVGWSALGQVPGSRRASRPALADDATGCVGGGAGTTRQPHHGQPTKGVATILLPPAYRPPTGAGTLPAPSLFTPTLRAGATFSPVPKAALHRENVVPVSPLRGEKTSCPPLGRAPHTRGVTAYT